MERCLLQTQAPPSSQDAPAGLQVVVGLLGLVAVPIVAWSLYTLSTTGALPYTVLPSLKMRPNQLQ